MLANMPYNAFKNAPIIVIAPQISWLSITIEFSASELFEVNVSDCYKYTEHQNH